MAAVVRAAVMRRCEWWREQRRSEIEERENKGGYTDVFRRPGLRLRGFVAALAAVLWLTDPERRRQMQAEEHWVS